MCVLAGGGGGGVLHSSIGRGSTQTEDFILISYKQSVANWFVYNVKRGGGGGGLHSSISLGPR